MTKKSSIVNMFFYAVIFLCFAGVVAFFGYFTSGFSSDFVGFYVIHDGKEIFNSGEKVSLMYEYEERFDCVYSAGFLNKNQSSGYKVKIITNAEKDSFDYMVDGLIYIYLSDVDVSDAFKVCFYERYFTIRCDVEIIDILKSLYSNQAVSLLKPLDEDNYYFSIIVTPNSSGKAIKIDFNMRKGVKA